MKVLLLFMFVAVAVTAEVENPQLTIQYLAENFHKVFRIPMADVLECIHKSAVTIPDMQYMDRSIDKADKDITNKESLRRASCSMVCCAQKKGIMVGGEVQLEEVYEYFKTIGVPEDINATLRECVRFCKDQVSVENISDDCMAGYKFMKCMYIRSKIVFEDK